VAHVIKPELFYVCGSYLKDNVLKLSPQNCV